MGSRETKTRLELQALLFFATNDFERASLNDIAEALGVTKGAIYHYFKGKDDLFKAAVAHLLNLIEDWFLNAIPTDRPFAVFMQGLFRIEETLVLAGEEMGLGSAFSEYRNVFYLLLTSLKKFPDLNERVDRIYTNFRNALIEFMKGAAARGEIRPDVDMEAVAYEITAFYEGALLLGAVTDRKDYAVLGPRVCDAILEWITPAGDSPEPTAKTHYDEIGGER